MSGEKIDVYPDAGLFGNRVPRYCFWIRHANGVTLDNIAFALKSPDARPEIAVGVDSQIVMNDGKAVVTAATGATGP